MRFYIAFTLVLILFLSILTGVFASELTGAQEYKENCARCHGSDGRGDGPNASEKPGYRAGDLTHIARSHHGTFPRKKIYDIVDGGQRLPGHYEFNSPMPLWGLSFQLKGKEYSGESEAVVTRRIDALLDYLESIQQR